ncbi:hypothetical protein AB1L07_24055 [Niallia alba]|uniref:hypothetical protein n=1 Tax=Niallia alba TaxID=2729105 RepID=UPI002904778B|nr:hypothetical protein [Niallia nealsonii]MED3793041.1 hypothetical protein [Niallia alba]
MTNSTLEEAKREQRKLVSDRFPIKGEQKGIEKAHPLPLHHQIKQKGNREILKYPFVKTEEGALTFEKSKRING